MSLNLCSKSRKCGRKDKHSGRCDTNRKIHAFWEASRFQLQNTLKREFRESEEQLRADYETKTAKFASLEDVRKRFTKEKAKLVSISSLFQSCKFLCGPSVKA